MLHGLRARQSQAAPVRVRRPVVAAAKHAPLIPPSLFIGAGKLLKYGGALMLRAAAGTHRHR